MNKRLVLNQPWRLLPVDRFRQGFYPLDDDSWVEQTLPAQWQQHALFARYAGKMVYRSRFTLDGVDAAAPTDLETRWWLRLNGTFYWSQPFFNGVDLGRHEGYFVPQEAEVTRWVAAENTLLLEVECVDEEDKLNKRQITGVFSHWDSLDPALNPGGPWLPIELIQTGATRIKEVLLDSDKVGELAADLRFRAVFDATVNTDVTLRWVFTPRNFPGEVQTITQQRALAQGVHEIAGRIRLRDPQLWWTHDMGDPNCYSVSLAVVRNDCVSDEVTFGFGIRTFELRDWVPYLNGVRFFAKGNNYGPGDAQLAAMTRAGYERDIELARDCHMNMLRIHGHVEHPDFYDVADLSGMLLWQDFPLQWKYHHDILPQALVQSRAMVRQLYNHPSLVIWCMHNESLHLSDTQDDRFWSLARTVGSAVFSNWNRRVMDTQLKTLAEREDSTRPVVRSSGEFALSPLHHGTDTHFYNGWYYLDLRSWEQIARHLPDNIRFVTEFGSQSFPNAESSAKFMSSEVSRIDWDNLVAHHCFQPIILARWVNWRGANSLEELARLTQDYQIEVNRFYIDRLRYYKYRPTGGVIPFMFHDSHPAVQWSVVDYWREPKSSYYAMRMAFSPQYLFTLVERDSYTVGTPVSVPIYVINDAHQEVDVALLARLLGPDGVELARLDRELTLPVDCMALEVENLRLTPSADGTYRLLLQLHRGAELLVDQEYELTVVAEETEATVPVA